MNAFEKETEKIFGSQNYKKIRGVKIGIAGLGGLGSNCAFNLARAGFKNFVLADFDKVSISNLNRQFYFQNQIGQHKTRALKNNLLKINPSLNIKLHNSLIEEHNALKVFGGCCVIVEAFDKAQCKSMICEQFINTDKLVVAASGIAGYGNTCAMQARKVKNNFYIAGDFKTAVSKKTPPLSMRVNIAAAIQADIILQWTLNEKHT